MSTLIGRSYICIPDEVMGMIFHSILMVAMIAVLIYDWRQDDLKRTWNRPVIGPICYMTVFVFIALQIVGITFYATKLGIIEYGRGSL